MKHRYGLHHEDYAIGENEALYARMARKGWLLEKRGVQFSRYRACEPQELKFRIEFSAPDVLDESTALPEEQVSLYEDCGWTAVPSRGLAHVFYAPEDSDAPEFYLDPAQQAATLKALRRSYRWGWLPVAVSLGLQFLMSLAFVDNASQALQKISDGFSMLFVTDTAWFLTMAALLMLGLVEFGCGAVRTSMLYHHLKKGRPLNHAPRKERRVFRAVCLVLTAVTVGFAALALAQQIGRRTSPLPERSDGQPYLLLQDLGVTGTAGNVLYNDNSNTVETETSLLCERWNLMEVRETATGSVLLRQQVYRARRETDALRLVPLLRRSAVLAHGDDSFAATPLDGFDEAYLTDSEAVLRRGNTVWLVTWLGADLSPAQEIARRGLA